MKKKRMEKKEFVIKLFKILNWVNRSVQATASLGVERKATEGIKKTRFSKNKIKENKINFFVAYDLIYEIIVLHYL